MKTPYGFPSFTDCLDCPVIPKGSLCDLPENSLKAFNRLRQNSLYPRHAVLFVQDQLAQGVYFVGLGLVKLFAEADKGNRVIYRICRAGSILGLSEALLGGRYQSTAETLEPCMVNYIKRADLNKLIRNDPEIGLRVMQQLSIEVRDSRHQIRHFLSGEKAIERMASFLISCLGDDGQLSVPLTQDEIGEILGLTRESVSRAVRDLKDRDVIGISGRLMTITNRDALLRISGTDIPR